MCDKKKERLEISKVTQIEKGFAHLPCTPPLFGFKMSILSGYILWVLEVSANRFHPSGLPRFAPCVSSSNSPQLMEMMHTLSPIRCLDNTRVLGWFFFGAPARSKKSSVRHNEAKLDSMVVFCWRCFCFGWFFGPFIMGWFDWLPFLMDMKSKKKEAPGMFWNGKIYQLANLNWWVYRISEPQNSIERCHVFICWRDES